MIVQLAQIGQRFFSGETLKRSVTPSRRTRRRGLHTQLGAIVLMAPLMLSQSGNESSEPAGGDSQCQIPASGNLEAEETPQNLSVEDCDLAGRKLEVESLAVAVPEEVGQIVTGELFGEDSSMTLELTVSADGIMTFQYEAASTDGGASPSADESDVVGSSTQGCNAGLYGFAGHKVVSSWQFFRGDGATPADSTKAEFGDAMHRAASNITGAQSPCDEIDGVDVSFNFAGETTYETDITPTATGFSCPGSGAEGQDTVSTVDFKPLGSDAIGAACTVRGDSGNLVEADVRLNSGKPWTFSPGSSACAGYNAFDVESILTHEFGHVYGLTDRAEDGTYYLTMHYKGTKCKKYMRTLGKGDLTGLRTLY